MFVMPFNGGTGTTPGRFEGSPRAVPCVVFGFYEMHCVLQRWPTLWATLAPIRSIEGMHEGMPRILEQLQSESSAFFRVLRGLDSTPITHLTSVLI